MTKCDKVKTVQMKQICFCTTEAYWMWKEGIVHCSVINELLFLLYFFCTVCGSREHLIWSKSTLVFTNWIHIIICWQRMLSVRIYCGLRIMYTCVCLSFAVRIFALNLFVLFSLKWLINKPSIESIIVFSVLYYQHTFSFCSLVVHYQVPLPLGICRVRTGELLCVQSTENGSFIRHRLLSWWDGIWSEIASDAWIEVCRGVFIKVKVSKGA